jgi:hypothetical protein
MMPENNLNKFFHKIGTVDGWIVGWPNISAYIGFSIRTTKTYHYKYHMPVRRSPGQKPIAIPWELDRWLTLFDEELKRRHPNEPRDRVNRIIAKKS